MDKVGDMEDVFMSQLEAGKRAVVVARTGHPFIETRRPATNFWRCVTDASTTVSRAKRNIRYCASRRSTSASSPSASEPPSTVEGLGNRQLLARGDGPAIAEWHWRIGKPIAVFVLALYALVLAHTDARRERCQSVRRHPGVSHLFNLLGLGQTLLKKGQISPLMGLWWLHIGMALVAIYLLRQRASNRPLIPLPRWRR